MDTHCKRGAGDRDRTLSRSCPTQKSKNFVSRARSRSAALRGSFRLVQKGSWACFARQRQRRHFVLARGHSAVLACATATAATLPTSTRLLRSSCGAGEFPIRTLAGGIVVVAVAPCYDQPVDNRTEPRTARQWIRYLVITVIALFLVWWMLRVYVL